MLPFVVVAARPSSSPVLARMNAPLQTDIVFWVRAVTSRIQASVGSLLLAPRTPPPGITSTSGCGAPANANFGVTVMPIAVVTGSFVSPTR